MVRIRCHLAPDFSLFKAFHHAPRPIKSEAIWYRRKWEIFSLWSSGIPHGKWKTNTQNEEPKKHDLLFFIMLSEQNWNKLVIFFESCSCLNSTDILLFLCDINFAEYGIYSWSKTALVSYECVHFPKKVLPSPWIGNFSLNIWWDVKSSTWPLLHLPEFEFLFWSLLPEAQNWICKFIISLGACCMSVETMVL